MAENLDLLFKIRGDAAGATRAAADTRAAIAQLRQSAGSDFNAIQGVSQNALKSIGDSLNVFVGQRIPLVGGAFVRVTENLKGLGGESAKSEKELAHLGQTINGIAQSTGRSSTQITAFLQKFVQLETQAKRDTSAIETFGAAAASKLIPQLEAAGTEMSALATAAPEAATGLAGVLAAMGPVGIAVAGVAVEVAAVVIGFGVLVEAGKSVVETFFGLAKSAAGFRGELFDLSQQTGVSVETLNALEISASKTGGSIESVAQSLVIFQGHLEEAQNDVSDAGKKFSELGISTNDTETAFRDALKALAAMDEGFHQTNEAAELFGRRGGKQVLAILKETNGDIDSAVGKLGDLAVVTTEESKAADEFNDALRDLHILLRNAIGKEAIPVATDALKELQRFLKENQGAVSALGTVVHVFALGLEGMVLNVTRGAEAINGLARVATSAIPGFNQLATALDRVRGISASLAGLSGTAEGLSSFRGIRAGVEGVEPKQAKKGSDPAVAEQRLAELNLKAALDNINEEDRVLERSLKNRTILFEQYALQVEVSEAQRHSVVIAGLIAEARAAEKLRDNLQKQIQLKEIDNKLTEENNRHQAAKDKLADRSSEILQQVIEFQKQQSEAAREALLGEKTAITITEEFIATKEKEGIILTESEKQWLRFNAIIIARKEALQNLLDVMRQQTDLEASTRSVTQITDDQIAAAAGAAANATSGLAPAFDDFDLRQAAVTAGLETMREAFDGLGQAVGQAVEAFVLYGSAGTSVRKVTAEVLASIAKMAAIKAIFELAEGFAALALAFFGIPNAGPSAQAHFAAAAIYGTIAGVAAVAGRAVAGDAFQQPASGSTNRGGGGASGNTSGSSSPATVEVDRNRFTQTIQHELVFTVRGDVVVDKFIQDYDLNGRTRIKILSEG